MATRQKPDQTRLAKKWDHNGNTHTLEFANSRTDLHATELGEA